MSGGLYVQYGCGWDAPSDWINFDASPTLRIERLPFFGAYASRAFKGNHELFPRGVQYGDIVKGLPVRSGSCMGVYCSHVLEHLSLSDCRRALVNSRQLLQQGGTFRLVLPDLHFYCRQYMESDDPNAAMKFMCDTGLGERDRPRGFRALTQELIGNSRHRWMWDYLSIKRELERAGFERVRRASCGDSTDAKFRQVERPERWKSCLGIECTLWSQPQS